MHSRDKKLKVVVVVVVAVAAVFIQFLVMDGVSKWYLLIGTVLNSHAPGQIFICLQRQSILKITYIGVSRVIAAIRFGHW
jgi:hypothetical protein